MDKIWTIFGNYPGSKLHWFVGLQYPLLNTTELGQGGSARYGGVDVNIPSGLVELMFGRWAELGNNPATT